jgi:hypothetical protein
VCYEVQLEDWRFARSQRNGIRGDWIFRSICEVPCLYATIKLLRQQDSVVFGCSCFSSLSPRRPSDIHHTLFKFMGPSLRRTATGRVIVRVRVRVYDARACFCKVEPALRDPAHENSHFCCAAHISWRFVAHTHHPGTGCGGATTLSVFRSREICREDHRSSVVPTAPRRARRFGNLAGAHVHLHCSLQRAARALDKEHRGPT